MVRIYSQGPSSLRKGTRYLIDQDQLNYIKLVVEELDPLVLEVGAGKGHISNVLPRSTILVENDLSHEKYLQDHPFVIWKSIFEITPSEISSCKTLVSNLPFDQGIRIIFHCVKKFPFLKKYLVILQKEVVSSMVEGGSVLYHKINHLFNVKFHREIPRTSYHIPPKVDTSLVELSLKENIDWDYIKFLNDVNQPRKRLHHNGIPGCIKRVQEVSSNQLYQLYKCTLNQSPKNKLTK